MNNPNPISFPPRKRRSDSAFAKLSPEDHTRLQAWLRENSYHKVVELVAQPAPEGFGIKTHITSLCRYYRQTIHDELLETRLDTGAEFQELAALCDSNPIAYHTIAFENLERRLMELSADPQLDLPSSLKLMNMLLRKQEFQLKHRQLQARSEKTQKPKSSFPLTIMNELVKSLSPTGNPAQPTRTAVPPAPVTTQKTPASTQPVAPSCTVLHAN